ncbi:hypothetical protein [Azohydromonas aeria]|uniref:hypothetical protein n=1 Tax=Azohydromonas aeria TaxID=2590212 RepID=UPI0012F9DB53|nr:hypothetical protein [Azohydromonas aeria]
MDTIKSELERIAAEHDGLLRPEDVVKQAADKAHPLHEHFQWDNTTAAHQWRLEQARRLIRSVRIEVPNQPAVAVQAFVSIPSDRKQEGGGYRALDAVLDNEFMTRQLAAEMQAKVNYWRNQCAALGLVIDFEPAQKIADTVRQASEGPRAAA